MSMLNTKEMLKGGVFFKFLIYTLKFKNYESNISWSFRC